MSADQNIEVQDQARLLIAEIRRAFESGTQHYRKSDGMPLLSEKEILTALVTEGEIILELPHLTAQAGRET